MHGGDGVRARSTLEWSDGAAGPLLKAEPDSPWQDAAACQYTDPEIFFPAPGDESPRVNAQAKRICRVACPVRTDCLSHALDTAEPHGTWGGFTEHELRKIRAAGLSAAQAIAAEAGQRVRSARLASAANDRRLAAERERREVLRRDQLEAA